MIIAAFINIVFIATTAQSALITLSDGSRIQADDILYSENSLTIVNEDDSVEFDRKAIRNISFAGVVQDVSRIEEASEDLQIKRKKALKILQNYPDVTAIMVSDEGNYQHRADGTNLSRYRQISYIVREEALWRSQVSLSFDPNRERVRVIHARSLSPDGIVYSLDPEQIQISREASGGQFFSHRKQLSFTIPQVETGSLIDYSYEIEEYNPFDEDLFQGRFLFTSFSPVGSSILRVSIPNNKKLHYVTKNFNDRPSEPEVFEAVDSRIYTWRAENIEPIIPEPSMPPYRDIAKGVYYSLHKDFESIHNKLRPMFIERLDLTEAVKEQTDKIIQNASDLQEKIALLYRFCQEEIRYISIKGNLASNQVGRSAEETLNNRYGDCTDKAMLLATMLKHIGVSAYPVGVRTNDSGRSIREIGMFDDNHAITEIHLDGRIFYLDSTATDYRYPYFRPDNHDTSARNTITGKINNVTLPPPENNSVEITRKIELLEDGTTIIDFNRRHNGSYEASARRNARNLRPEEYERSVRTSISSLSGDYELKVATHSDPLDFSQPFKSRSVYKLNNYAPRSGNYMIFEIPFFELSFPEISLENRTYDINYTTTRLRTEQISIKIPINYQVEYIPSAIRVQSPYVEYEAIYDIDVKKRTIRINRKLAFPRRIVPVSAYQDYKNDLQRIANSSKDRIFLQKTVIQGDKE